MREITEIFGEDNVLREDITKLIYSSDASMIRGSAEMVVFPRDKNQIQRLITITLKNNFNLVPRGAGTGLAGSAVPQNSIVMDFTRMNKILDMDAEKKYVVVEPGVVLKDLNDYLARFDLYFPVVPSSHKVCTIGGMISTNATGERSVKYGATSQWILELEIIDGKGNRRILKKDVSEFCGTEGVLGIITQAKLLLTEPLKERSLSLLKFDNISDMVNKIEKYQNNNVVSVEFFDRYCARLSNIEEGYYLLIEFNSHEGEINNPEEISRIWSMRESMGPLLSSENYTITEDPKIPLSVMKEFLLWLENNEIPSFGHIAMGIIHPRFKKEQTALIREMFTFVDKLDGKVSGEHGIGIAKKEFVNEKMANKIKSLKSLYDPDNILNRGKLI